jgi:hypothetical protein
MTEMAVALGMLVVLAGVVLLNLGTFFGAGDGQARNAERYRVAGAVAMYRVDGFTQPFTIGPDNKGPFGPYLSDRLQYYWIVSADGSVRPGTGSLFSSDLNNFGGFTTLTGDWEVGGGVLSSARSQSSLVVTGVSWEDFIFQTTAALVSGNGYGIYYRCDSNPNITGYSFQFDAGPGKKFAVSKVVAGNESIPFQAVNMPAGFQVNGQHNLSVSVQGGHHIIKVDGGTVMDFHDSQFSSGTVGLRSWGNNSKVKSTVNFTEFKVIQQ